MKSKRIRYNVIVDVTFNITDELYNQFEYAEDKRQTILGEKIKAYDMVLRRIIGTLDNTKIVNINIHLDNP